LLYTGVKITEATNSS